MAKPQPTSAISAASARASATIQAAHEELFRAALVSATHEAAASIAAQVERLMLDRAQAVSPKRAAELLDVSEKFIHDAIRRGELVSAKLGAARRIPMWALRKYLDERTEEAR